MGKAVVFLMGPTASGKTALACRLCDDYPFEIISVDSMLVYRGMDIGTAKPTRQELSKYPHHLIDIRDPGEPYSAADFCRDAYRLIESISAKGRIPLLVGGTMMYFKALKDGLAQLPSADPLVRKTIMDIARSGGWQEVHRRLAAVDPVTASRLRSGDSQRLQRALEVFELTGIPISVLQAEQTRPFPYPVCQLGLLTENRADLYQRIERRFHDMLKAGWLDEVRHLYECPALNAELPSIRATGYRQIWQYLDGDIDYKTMIEKGVIATRQLAKRQMTWLRGWPDLHRIDAAQPDLFRQSLKILQRDDILDRLS